MTSVLLAGATGLVGRECLRQLLAEPAVTRVVAVTRRPLSPDTRVPKLEPHVVDFDRLDAHRDLFAVDAIVCALGTTIRHAGTRARFRTVDYEYPLALARLGREAGARHFLVVSALGADPASRVFYNRVKGELEEALCDVGYPSLTIVRPSLLLGPRAEFRAGEAVAKRVGRLLGWAMPRRYRPVPAAAVAASLVRALVEGKEGTKVLESEEIAGSG